MTGYPCCCVVAGCWTRFDDFDRATLGSAWNQVIGTWEIINYPPDGEAHELAATTQGEEGTANAAMIYTTPVPIHSAGEMYVSIRIIDAQVGDVYRIYPCCQDDSTLNGTYAEFVKTDSDNNWTISLGGESSGVVASEVTPNEIFAWVCVDDLIHMMGAGLAHTDGQDVWIDDDDAGNGRYAGIGHNNPTTGTPSIGGGVFDEFRISEIRKADGQICHQCWCSCGLTFLKKIVTLTFTGQVGTRSECLDGVSFDLVWEYNGGVERWYGFTNVTGANSVTVKVEAFLTCGMGDYDDETQGDNFTLTLLFDESVGACCAANQALCLSAPSIVGGEGATTCDPLNIVFGPYSLVSVDCYLCYNPGDLSVSNGNYWATITEST